MVDGAPAVRLTHNVNGIGAYPLTGPRSRCFEYGAPRLSIQRLHSPTGIPAPSTGTVLDHWPVQLTASTWCGSTTPEAIAATGRVRNEVPPLGRVLHRAPAREQAGLDRAVVVPGHRAGERHEPDLRPTGAEIDREDEPLLAIHRGRERNGRGAGGGADQLFGSTVSWLSIMSAMTALMKSSASSVSPPATPP